MSADSLAAATTISSFTALLTRLSETDRIDVLTAKCVEQQDVIYELKQRLKTLSTTDHGKLTVAYKQLTADHEALGVAHERLTKDLDQLQHSTELMQDIGARVAWNNNERKEIIRELLTTFKAVLYIYAEDKEYEPAEHDEQIDMDYYPTLCLNEIDVNTILKRAARNLRLCDDSQTDSDYESDQEAISQSGPEHRAEKKDESVDEVETENGDANENNSYSQLLIVQSWNSPEFVTTAPLRRKRRRISSFTQDGLQSALSGTNIGVEEAVVYNDGLQSTVSEAAVVHSDDLQSEVNDTDIIGDEEEEEDDEDYDLQNDVEMPLSQNRRYW